MKEKNIIYVIKIAKDEIYIVTMLKWNIVKIIKII